MAHTRVMYEAFSVPIMLAWLLALLYYILWMRLLCQRRKLQLKFVTKNYNKQQCKLIGKHRVWTESQKLTQACQLGSTSDQKFCFLLQAYIRQEVFWYCFCSAKTILKQFPLYMHKVSTNLSKCINLNPSCMQYATFFIFTSVAVLVTDVSSLMFTIITTKAIKKR